MQNWSSIDTHSVIFVSIRNLSSSHNQQWRKFFFCSQNTITLIILSIIEYTVRKILSIQLEKYTNYTVTKSNKSLQVLSKRETMLHTNQRWPGSIAKLLKLLFSADYLLKNCGKNWKCVLTFFRFTVSLLSEILFKMYMFVCILTELPLGNNTDLLEVH